MKQHSPASDRHVWSRFFWSDWRGDEKLGLCSYAARGLWMECLALMATSPVKGHLLIGGKAPTVRELSILTRGMPMQTQRCLEELTARGVCSWTDAGVLVSRRMVRDAKRSERNHENGSKGGNPVLLDKPPDKPQSKSRLTESVKPHIPEARSQKPEEQGERGDRAPTRELLSLFDELHREKFGTKAAIHGAKDAALLAKLWRDRRGDPASVDALIRAFFASRDPFIAHAGFTVGVFVSQVGKLLAHVSAPVQEPREDWFEECKRLHDGKCLSQFTHGIKVSA